MSSPNLPTETREYHLTDSTGISALKITQVKVPPLKEDEVLVKIHAVSLQYRDLVITLGQYPLGVKPNVIPGSDCAGEVLNVGGSVKGFKPGDRVSSNFAPSFQFGDVETEEERDGGLGGLVDGVLTEYRAFPAHGLVHIPEHLSYEEASTLPCAAVTAYNCLHGPVPLKGGDTVLVLGTGGVSIFALQLAKAGGATVIATTSSEAKAAVLKKLGADHIIDYNTTPDWDKEVLKLTGGRGVDHVIEVGGAGTIMKSINSTRLSGWVHIIGFLASGGGDTSDILVKCLTKSLFLRGILVGSRTQFENMNRFISAVQLKPIVDKVFSFYEYPQALEYLSSQKHVGKIVIKVAKA
ncbi:NAD-binding protein [Phellopilus nigrolimitatus]|nr:NAD-binding protein [Phellopilus nigrolimitatus]